MNNLISEVFIIGSHMETTMGYFKRQLVNPCMLER